MKLLGRDLSPFVRRSATILNTLSISYDRAKLATEEDGPEIRKSNPLGRVPALILDDNSVIIDSHAIVDYALEIADTGHSLCPADGDGRRRVLYLSAIAIGAMEKGVASSYEKNRRPADKIHRPWLERLRGQMGEGLRELEAAAADRTWLVGETMTLADIDTVVAYDFAMIVHPATATEAAPKHLPALSERANALPAIANTNWKRQQ